MMKAILCLMPILIITLLLAEVRAAPPDIVPGRQNDAALATHRVWVPTGSMNVWRSNHTATLLSNGKVLVVGGIVGAGNATASAELYDPTTRTWSVMGELSRPRAYHTATLLNDGRVLVAGGASSFLPRDCGTDTAELYDPSSGTWAPAASMGLARFSHTATLLQDGRVLVAGGCGSFLNKSKSAELFDPATGAWLPTGPLKGPRDLHTATRLTDGSVLIAKGSDSGDTDWDYSAYTAERYDPGSGSWGTVDQPSGYSVFFHTATLLFDGKVLLAGGYTTKGGGIGSILALSELYDPAHGDWTLTTMLAPRQEHTATLMPDGSVLVAGGYPSFASVERFDPDTASWTIAPSLNAGRSEHTATLLLDGSVLVAGGTVGQPDSELYVSQPGPPSSIVPAIEYYNAAFDDYFITSAPDEIASIDRFLSSDWRRTGKSFLVWSEALAGLSPVCRLFSGQTFAPKSTHFYTAYAEECAALQAPGSGWEVEGEVFALQLPQGAAGQRACPPGTAALYRLYNNLEGGVAKHRYTNEPAVVDDLRTHGWLVEVKPRRWSSRALRSDRTTDKSSYDSIQQENGHGYTSS
jgi:hypothetical protein